MTGAIHAALDYADEQQSLDARWASLLAAARAELVKTGAALTRIADFPCNCPSDKLPGDECKSCIARAARDNS